MLCFSSSLSRARLKMPCFSSSGCGRKCRVFPIPFLQRVRSAVFFQFPFSFPVPFQFPFQFPSRIPYVFPRKVRCRLFLIKNKNVFFFKRKKSATHFPWKNIGNPRRELGRELGRELEGNWKGTGKEKGNWKNTALRTR